MSISLLRHGSSESSWNVSVGTEYPLYLKLRYPLITTQAIATLSNDSILYPYFNFRYTGVYKITLLTNIPNNVRLILRNSDNNITYAENGGYSQVSVIVVVDDTNQGCMLLAKYGIDTTIYSDGKYNNVIFEKIG